MEIEQFNRIVTNLQAPLLRQARTLEGGDADANDFVQETFLRLWTMRERLDKPQNIEALAMATLKHIAIDHWRHRRYYECNKGEQTQDLIIEKDYLGAKDEMAFIGMIVEHLPPLQQQIFRLKDIDGYENEEITKICGCTVEAVRQNLSRARRRIQKEYVRLTIERNKLCK